MRLWKSSLSSNTTARPLCTINAGVAALGLITAPRGDRLPRSTAMPACALNGCAIVLMTRGSQFCASAMFSRTVLPVTVTWSRCSTPEISFITAGTPPA